MKKRLIGLLLVLCMVASLFVAGIQPAAVADAQPIDQAIVQGGAILHCFDWSFDEIREALPDIKAAGYAAVQTSPVQPPKDYNGSWTDTGGNWWKLYQPLDFCVVGENGSWLGSKADLSELCSAAEKQGIYVIVDVVANHTANITGGGYTVNGTYNVSNQVADRLQDPDGSKDLYHTYENGTNDNDRFTMTQYHLSMPDLNTGNSDVQDMVLDFLKECVDCGVDGFRFDAAKHIELPGDSGCGSNFWPYVLNGIRDYAGANNLYIYGESLSGSGSDAWVNEFITYMGLTDSQAGNQARGAVVDQNAGLLAVSGYTRGNSPKDYVIWAESHDTYEDGGSTGVSSAKIIKTWGIVGARADSTALFLARPNELMGAASTDTAWKSPAVAAVNAFKNHYDGTGEYISYNQDAKITWIERGTSGGDAGVSIVKLDGAGSVNLDAHLMSTGCYLDEITGNVFTVSGGKISGTVGPTGVAVVYQKTAEPSESPSPSTEPTTRTLYLKPNSNWKMADARFAMYSWGSGEHWTSMTRVDGETEDIYEAELPSGDTTVIFVRMNPGEPDNNWNNKWNQTGDLAVPSDKNLFTLAEGVWDGATTTWSAYGDVGGGDPTPVTEDAGYYLVGTMTGWSIAPEFKMTRTGASTEEYMIEVPLVRTSKPYNSQFKVVYSPDGITDRTWFPSGFDNNYGDYTGEIPQSGVYTVYFRPNYDGGDGWHDGCIYAERTKFFVTVNDADKNGTVTVDKDVAAEGETVTVTVTPNEGYALDTLVYMCETGFNTGEFDITEIDGTTFEMPAENAAVKATFKQVYTVILDPGDGTGEPIVYRSDEQEEIVSWRSSDNLKFCYDDDGSMMFRMNPDYCPDSFTAPEGQRFYSWTYEYNFLDLTASKSTIKALWTVDGVEAAYHLSPSEYTLAEEEYTDILCTQDGAKSKDPATLELTFHGGTLNDGSGHEIPFTVGDEDHDGFGTEYTLQCEGCLGYDETETYTVAVKIDPADLAAAEPGTYTGNIVYSSIWTISVFNEDELTSELRTYDGASGTIALTLTVAEKPSFKTQQLILSGEIGVQFFADLSMLTEEEKENAYVTFAISGKGTVNADPVYASEYNKNADGYYGFKCNVNALQLADTITATLHYGDNQTVEKTYSVKQYVDGFDAALANNPNAYDAKTIALVHALADYSHYVQIFLSSINNWEINTGDEPDNNKYAQMMEDPYTAEYEVDEIKGITTTEPYQMTVEGSDAFKAPSMSLVLDSETAIRIFLAHADGSKLNADDVTVTVTPATGVAWDAQTQLQKTQKGNRVMVEIKGVKAAWLTETFTITATEGANTQTIGVCALTYVGKLLASEAYAENTAAQNAVCALYAYAMAAKDFIN